MKAKLLIVLAAVAMLFTACGPKDDPEVGNNQMIYNGVTYQLTSYYEYNEEMYFYEGDKVVDDENEAPSIIFFGEGYKESLNTTIDLTKGPIENLTGYIFILDCADGSIPSLNASNQNNSFYGCIGNEWYDEATIFKSGTLTITLDDEGFTYLLNGVLLNDDTIALKLYVPKEDFHNIHEQ